ncbi:MAG: DinB family protein, partial [Candidatus Acidiferrum sp.]
ASIAQQKTAEPNPVSSAVKKIMERQSKNLTAAAEEMPAEKYGFKPTPAQMSYGELMLHIAGSNNFLCAHIAGLPEPAESKLTENDAKEKLVHELKASFDYCEQALAAVDDSKLSNTVTIFSNRQVTRVYAMIILTDDWYDHYGAAAIYLRLNGLLPPTAQPKK